MTHGSIIGYDINAKMCQISYYNEKTQEPETVDTGIEKENNQIPLVMNYYKETWTYGRQARRMSTVRDSICVEGIWECTFSARSAFYLIGSSFGISYQKMPCLFTRFISWQDSYWCASVSALPTTVCFQSSRQISSLAICPVL